MNIINYYGTYIKFPSLFLQVIHIYVMYFI